MTGIPTRTTRVNGGRRESADRADENYQLFALDNYQLFALDKVTGQPH
jgi:hypothetical protein